jgi:hypothetical protein
MGVYCWAFSNIPLVLCQTNGLKQKHIHHLLMELEVLYKVKPQGGGHFQNKGP